MNYRMILRLLCSVLRIVAAFMIPAAVISICYGEMPTFWGFIITMALMLLLSLTAFIFPAQKKTFYAREAFVLASITWLMVSVLGCLPFVIGGAIPRFIDALFETASGFTTTGSSIVTDYGMLTMGAKYWRSFTHWLGGMGVLVFLLSIEPITSGSGSGDSIHIMRAESPGPQVSKLVPHTLGSARILYLIYMFFTVLMFGFLMAGGMNVFDAVTTAFATAGTGGFALTAESIGAYSPYIQWVVAVFMMLFGVNFGIYYLVLQRQFKKALRNSELWVYLIVMLLSTTVIFYFVRPQYGTEDGLRNSFFQVSAIMTSTGFATADFNVWPQFARTLLVGLMLMGACAGSTGGGFKVSRVIMLFKALQRELKRSLHPNSVAQVHIDGESISSETIDNTYAFLVAYCLIVIFSTIVLSLDNTSFETNLTAVISCLNNIGPGLDMVGPMGGYSEFSVLSKIVLILNMLLGRLEIFPILILFVPGVWKKARN